MRDFPAKENPPAMARAAGLNEIDEEVVAHVSLSFAGLAATYSSAS
jgi:hypothetical protein